MLYIAVLTYIRPVEEIDACLADHIAWLEEGYQAGAFIASGRRVPRNGGVILIKGDSLEDVEARLSQDPFQTKGLAKVEVIPFEPSKRIAALEGVI